MSDNHPALERASELGEEEMILHEADAIRAILVRHDIAGDNDLVLDLVGYYTGMLRCDGSKRGRRHTPTPRSFTQAS